MKLSLNHASKIKHTPNSLSPKQIPLSLPLPIMPKTTPKTFDVIYTDPPWDYNGRSFRGKKANDTGAASDHYPTMTLLEMMNMNVKQIRSKNSIMYMWTTGPQLDASIQLMKAWGYKYKTMAFVWNKRRTNPGYYTMSQCEFVIVGTYGAIPKPRGKRNIRQFLEHTRGKHSAKPCEIRRRIEMMHPTQTKLEMFARDNAPGWFAWGNQTPNPAKIML